MKKLLVFALIMLLMFAAFTIFLIPALSVALPERLENQALSARLTWTPQELVPGNNATFTLSIKNTAASTVSNVKVRISGNYYPFTPEELGKQPALADTFDLLLSQLTDAERNKLTAFNIEKILPILAANSQESISHTYKLPSTNLLPTLVVRVKIEGLPDKEEKRYIIPVQAPGVNAKISSFTSSKTTGLTKGQTLTFSATVKNLSKSLFPGVLGLYAGETLLLEKPLLLSGNQSSVIKASWTVPGPGAYNIKAVFNKAFLPEFLHSLADSPSSLTLTVPDLKPDLTITKIETVPAGVVPGSTANIQVTVQNKGGTSCPAGSKLTLTAGGQSSEANLPALNKNTSKTVNFNKFLFPSTENFVISAKVNPPPGTVESDEKNNFLEYTPSLLFPDLTITKLTMTPSSAAPGAPVKITASVKNTGAGQCPAGGYVELLCANREPVRLMLPALGKNSYKDLVFNNYPLPLNAVDIITAKASPPEGIKEISTANNTRTLTPNLLLPSISIESFSASGAWPQGKPALGDWIILKTTVKNTSNIKVTGLPVHIIREGQVINTALLNIDPKKSASTEFALTVPPLSLPANKNSIVYTAVVNPAGAGGPPTSPAELRKDLNLEILKTGQVLVSVRDEADNPLEGFTVTCTGHNYYRQVENGERTIAVFTNVPIGYPFTVTASKPGYNGYNGQHTFSGTLMNSDTRCRLYFTNTGTISVSAKSQATGNTLSGVGVEVVGPGMWDLTTQGKPATFTLPSGTYTFKLTKRGYAPTTITGSVTAGQNTIITGSLPYTSITHISGYVLNQHGNPMPNQQLKIYKALEDTQVASLQTNASGYFSIDLDNSGLFYMYLKSTSGSASGRSEPQCFWPGLDYRVDLIVAPPPPPPPSSGWHETARKGCARAHAASVPDTFFTQGWDVDSALGLFAIRMKYNNQQFDIRDIHIDLIGGPAAIYNVHTTYNPGSILGETGAAAAQSLAPTMSDSAADFLSFLIEMSAPGIDLNATGSLGRTIACLDRLEVIDRDTGEVLWYSNNGFNTMDSGYNWQGKSYNVPDLPWSKSVIRAYLYLDGSDMLGPNSDRCKMVSWDVARGKLRYFNAPRNHPRFNIND